MLTPGEIAEQSARQAGALLMGYFSPAGIDARTKSDHSLVTDADVSCNHLLTGLLRTAIPQASLLSEEGATSLATGESPAWIIDPLDGTTNFSLGLPIWGVSIAYFSGGQLQAGALYFPLLNELYCAERGQGAYLNGRPIHARSLEADRPAAFFSCCSRTHRKFDVNLPYKTRILGATAYTFCCVARGLAVIGFEATPKIWDLAAGWLLVEEAGGIVQTYDYGSYFPLQPDLNYTQVVHPVIVAANTRLANQARKQITPK